MRPVRGLALVCMALLLASQASAWEQLRGGPDRASIAILQEVPLDVVGRTGSLPKGADMSSLLGPDFVETPHGLVGVARDSQTGLCVLVVIEQPPSGLPRWINLANCRWPWFQGYDRRSDALFLCSVGTADEPVFQARNASDGQLVWSVSPTDADLTENLGSAPGGNLAPQLKWSCSGVAIDPSRREAIVPFLSSRTGAEYVRHRIVSASLDDHRVQWSSQIPFASLPASNLPNPPSEGDGTGFEFAPFAATATSTGIVVTGTLACQEAATCDLGNDEQQVPIPFEWAMGWMTRDGAVQGVTSALKHQGGPTDGSTAADRVRSGSIWAASNGPLAAEVLGRSLLLVNPQSRNVLEEIEIRAVQRPEPLFLSWTAPAWANGAIIVPLDETLEAFNEVGHGTRWF